MSAMPTKKARKDILTVEELISQLEKAQEGHTQKQARIEVKDRVFRFEPSNTEYIVLYASSEEWYKVGGNSALFLSLKYGPQVGQKFKINIDTDFYSTFPGGVISIPRKKIKTNVGELKKLGVKWVNSLDPEVAVILKIPKPILKSEIRELKQKSILEYEEYNQNMYVDKGYPELSGMVRQVLPMLYRLASTLGKIPRETFVYETIDWAKTIQRAVVQMANGRRDKLKTLLEIDILIDKIYANISMMIQVGIIEAEYGLKYAKYLHGARMAVTKEIKAEKKAKKEQKGNGK